MTSSARLKTAVTAGALTAVGALLLGLSAGYSAGGGTAAPTSEPAAPSAAQAQQAADVSQGSSVVPTGLSANSGDAFSQQFPFYGKTQSGVETPAALHQWFIGFDLKEKSADYAQGTLRLVSDDAARLMAGEPALGDLEPEIAKRTAGLTITVGLGEGFYAAAGAEPPEQLRRIPEFDNDQLDKKWGQTDFVVQIGAHDPLTLSHAARMVAKDIRSLATAVWRQEGFRSGADVVEGYDLPRNQLGQVDGIVNPEPGSEDFKKVVWIDSDDPTVDGGTVLVLRRIELLTDKWDELDLVAQEQVMGRERDTGAPIGGKPGEAMPFDKTDKDGLPVIDNNAHARVSHATSLEGMVYRRPYNYDVVSSQQETGLEVGLLFAAYMRDPQTSFIPMQQRISQSDAFNEWNTTIGSATYFMLPGAAEGSYLGEGLFQ